MKLTIKGTGINTAKLYQEITQSPRFRGAIEAMTETIAQEIKGQAYVGATRQFREGVQGTVSYPLIVRGLTTQRIVRFDFSNAADKAEYRNAGRGAGGFPNYPSLLRWVLFKGMPASATYPIGRVIAQRGTIRWRSGQNLYGLTNDGKLIPGGFASKLPDRINQELRRLL